MPNFDIVKTSLVKPTYRVAKVKGLFDIQSENIQERFVGDINLPEHWQIGIIVGASGTGKSTIAKYLFGEYYFNEPKFDKNSVLDNMPNNDVNLIVKTFNSVGFSSPPSWLKPYNVLSNGEKMRAQLAWAILSDKQMFVFDEYTSVVDRNVAQIGSSAIQKAIKKTNKQFIAVTCHYDVLDWLEPDWVFDTNTMTMQKKTSNDQILDWTYTKQKDIGECLANIII